MRIRFLGTGSCVPSLRRNPASILIEADKRVLVDIGPSTVRRLLEFGYTVRDIDAIILTHFHVDHSSDLPAFLFASNFDLTPRNHPLLLLGGRGVKTFVHNLILVYPWIKPRTYSMSVRSLGRPLAMSSISIDAMPVNHNRESMAIRLKEGDKVLVISGDTDFSKNLIRLARGCDLLIAECSFPERKVEGHMNLQVLSSIVQKAEPKRVMITHLYPEWEEYEKPLPPPFLIAEDGMEVDL